MAAGLAALAAGAFTVDLRTTALLTVFDEAFAVALVAALPVVLTAAPPAAGFFDPAAFALAFTFAVLTLRTTEPSQQMNRKSMAD
ncbi:MAG TPA: hypothetical protein PKA20_16975 [Burkholderiaceae bacterium]|nr:hypothetical protein [Burkholderiaceae bacterium]